MVFIKHNSLKSDIFFNPLFLSCFSGSSFFRVQVFQGTGFSGSRFSRVGVQGSGLDFRSSPRGIHTSIGEEGWKKIQNLTSGRTLIWHLRVDIWRLVLKWLIKFSKTFNLRFTLKINLKQKRFLELDHSGTIALSIYLFLFSSFFSYALICFFFALCFFYFSVLFCFHFSVPFPPLLLFHMFF